MFATILNFPSTALGFTRKVWGELKQVEWLSIRQTFKYTGSVLLIVILLTLIILAMDTVLVAGRNYLFAL